MDTTPALDTALSQERAIMFIAVKIELPGQTVRLLDGSGEVTWSEGTFSAVDANFGTINTIETLTDGIDEEAPTMSMSFLPDNAAGVATICDPSFQGSRIRIWIGALDTTTKAVVADPYNLFDGMLDVPQLNIDQGTREVEMTCASSFERLFMDEEGLRLSPSNHKDTWPGEEGLDQITGVIRQVIWGPGDKISGSSPGGRIGSNGGPPGQRFGGKYGGNIIEAN